MGARYPAIATLMGALALVVAAVSPAQASTWTVRQVEDGPTQAILWGVSCPSTSLCVAVGTNSTIVSSTEPTGSASAWKAVHPEGYSNTESPPGSPPGSEAIYAGNAIRGVSCPSIHLCVAAGPQGNLLTSTDPTGDVSAWSIAELGREATRMNAISCPSPSLCVAVAYNGKVITSTNPAGGATAWTITALETPLDLLGVSCASASLCVAVDNEGRIVASTNPTGGPSAWQSVGVPAGSSSLNGVSCPSHALCVTGNAGQMITSTDPADAASWKAASAGTGLPVKGVSCVSTSACAAVDNNADVITSTDPTGGPDAWSFVNVIPAPFRADGTSTERFNGMFGISCHSRSLCVAVGTRHQIIASTDPFGEDEARIPIGKSKRPRVRITRHPAKRLDPRKGGTRVVFRFRALGGASRFKCKLHARRFSRCKSPIGYRVGRGRHAFKVFAVGPNGLRGPVTTFHFRVGALMERAPASTCKPGQKGSLRHPCIPLA